MKKYVDETGLKRALQKIKPYMGEGGSSGSGEAGRIVLTDIDLNDITEVNSYIVTGNVLNLPDEINDVISNFEDVELCLDIKNSLNIQGLSLNFIVQEISSPIFSSNTDLDRFEYIPQMILQRTGYIGGSSTLWSNWELTSTKLVDVDLNKIITPGSYVLSGVVEGFPDDIAELLYNKDNSVINWGANFDVMINIEMYDEEDDIKFYVTTQRIEFLSLDSLVPNKYERTCMYDVYPYEVEEEEGYIKIDDNTQMYATDWKTIDSPSDYKFMEVGRFSDMFIPIFESVYLFGFYYPELSENIVIDDLYMFEDYDINGRKSYTKLSSLDLFLRSNDLGSVHQLGVSFNGDTNNVDIAVFRFNDESDYDEFMDTYGNWSTFVAYRNTYEVIY